MKQRAASGSMNSVEGMANKRILHVDDEPLVGTAVRLVLRADGHEIEFVTDPMKALLENYAPMKYHLVITDLQMEKMTGLELAERIKRQCPEQPVMLLTAYPPPGPTAVVDLVLSKPFSADQLRTAVAQLTSQAPPTR